MSKILKVNNEEIVFEDGSKITYDHDRDCCECNYADFKQLDDLAKQEDFDTKNMIFESIEGSGFRFGNPYRMFFIPCYSAQNGYYSSDIDIYYNDEQVLNLDCKLDLY